MPQLSDQQIEHVGSRLKTNHILTALRQGGLVMANRQTGKTTALAMLAKEMWDQDPVVVCANSSMARYFVEAYRKLGSEVTPVVVYDADATRGRRGPVLVDEWFACSWAWATIFPGASFIAATASNPWGNMKVTVVD